MFWGQRDNWTIGIMIMNFIQRGEYIIYIGVLPENVKSLFNNNFEGNNRG